MIPVSNLGMTIHVDHPRSLGQGKQSSSNRTPTCISTGGRISPVILTLERLHLRVVLGHDRRRCCCCHQQTGRDSREPPLRHRNQNRQKTYGIGQKSNSRQTAIKGRTHTLIGGARGGENLSRWQCFSMMCERPIGKGGL